MKKLLGLCVCFTATVGCGLFGDTSQPPPTTATISPTVSFPTGLDCSSGGADPIEVTWDVKPISLTSPTMGQITESSTQESLVNSAGTPDVCYYTPALGTSAASGSGLSPGTWQITMTHQITGYPNPVICSGPLMAGDNSIFFNITLQGAGCQ